MKLLLVLILFSFGHFSLAETYTQSNEISKLEFKQYGSGDDAFTYFNVYSDKGTWAPEGCGNQSVVTFKSKETLGYESFLSLVLAAKLANREVSFNGECVDATSMKGTNITVY